MKVYNEDKNVRFLTRVKMPDFKYPNGEPTAEQKERMKKIFGEHPTPEEIDEKIKKMREIKKVNPNLSNEKLKELIDSKMIKKS